MTSTYCLWCSRLMRPPTARAYRDWLCDHCPFECHYTGDLFYAVVMGWRVAIWLERQETALYPLSEGISAIRNEIRIPRIVRSADEVARLLVLR